MQCNSRRNTVQDIAPPLVIPLLLGRKVPRLGTRVANTLIGILRRAAGISLFKWSVDQGRRCWDTRATASGATAPSFSVPLRFPRLSWPGASTWQRCRSLSRCREIKWPINLGVLGNHSTTQCGQKLSMRDQALPHRDF
ncbi:hypothetical protein SRHO_G00050670 [Serrasalmus rhombeus]